MTKRELIEGYYAAQADGSGQWYQRWSTMTDMHGSVYLKIGIGDPFEHYEQLDGLVEHHSEIRGLRRWEWYAIRHEGDEGMDLYRFSPGVEQVAEHINAFENISLSLTRCFVIFRSLFKDAGGFTLRDSEAKSAARAADEVSRMHSKSYR
jgi:hypothetical protein